MAPNANMRERKDDNRSTDPRDNGQDGAEVIDLATRNVLPSVTQRKRGDGLGLVAGIGIVAGLGALTLWSMDAARNGAPEKAQAPAVQQTAQQSVAAPAKKGGYDPAKNPLKQNAQRLLRPAARRYWPSRRKVRCLQQWPRTPMPARPSCSMLAACPGR